MAEAKKTKVGITIPKRPEYGNAYWAIQRKFDSGFHIVEVDERELAELRVDPVANIIEGDALEVAITVAAAAQPDAEPEKKPAESPGKPMKR